MPVSTMYDDKLPKPKLSVKDRRRIKSIVNDLLKFLEEKNKKCPQ